MTNFDFPDFQRLDQWIADPVAYDTALPVPTSLAVYGPFFVGPYESLEFYFQELTGTRTMSLGIFFYRDQAMTQLLTTYTYWGGLLPISDSVPVQGAWVKFQCGFSAINASLQTVIIPRRGFNSGPQFTGGQMMWARSNINVGAGATSTFELSPVTTGPAAMTISCQAAAWTASIAVFDVTGQIGHVASTSNVNGGQFQTVPFLLPPNRCQLQITNFDAAARTFFGAIVPSSE